MAFFFSAGPIVPGGRQVDDKLVLLIIAAVTNFALGALVLLKNPGLLVNRLFAVLSFLIGLWPLFDTGGHMFGAVSFVSCCY